MYMIVTINKYFKPFIYKLKKNSMKYVISIFILLCCSVVVGQNVYEIDTKYPVHEIDTYLKVYTDSLEILSKEMILKDSSDT